MISYTFLFVSVDAINTLLSHGIPLGDALIRCIEENFEDAILAICRYLASNPVSTGCW